MEPTPKKRRQNEKEFMDLNDDCIGHILWKLTPTDLCSMSFTCERMKRLAFDHFPRQYPTKKITIVMDMVGSYIRNSSQKHMKYFAKCIRNIRIDVPGTRRDLQSLFDFIQAECCGELRTLELKAGGRLTESHIEVIKGHLENLTTLQLEQPFSRYDIYHVLLTHCKKLEHLIITSKNSFDSSWMQHSYPTLTRVTINVTSKKQIQKFVLFAKNFLQLNPQITQFTCYENDIIKSVLTNAVKIDELTVRFTSWSQLQPLVDLFNECSKCIDIQTLKLSMGPQQMTVNDGHTLQSLNAVRPVNSLSCFFMGLTSKATFMSEFKFLEEVYLHFPQEYGNEEEILTLLSEQLPNMQDLRFNFNGRRWMFKDVAMRFVKNCLKLKFLNFVMCYINTFVFHPNDLVALNECRSTLTCAVPIKIRMDYDNYKNFEQPTFIQPARSVMNVTFKSMWGDDE